MGRIKSALEIALERTESVKTDKASIGLYETKQQGKRLANAFLADPSKNPEDELNKYPKDQWESLKQGIFEVLTPQITLPVTAEDLPRIEAVGRGLQLLIKNGRFAAMYKQLVQVLSDYLGEAAQFEQAIRQQYAPKLRQKEEELSRRMGREIRLDPFQDPEFAAFYNQNLNALKANYQTAVDQVRSEAQRLWDELHP
ncbi:MAG: hypothetical protein LBH20_08240 [Treponema sp.]|jgi:predicted component of type VI protein secretion system|nr:hypothetical protein [Treponema sp.]